MKWTMSIVAAAVLATCAGVAAQSGNSMGQGKKTDRMAKNSMDATYTGCVQAAGAGKFALTDAVASKDGLAGSSMKEPSMKKDSVAMDAANTDAMMSTTLALSSTAVDLSKHVGQRVSVTGSLASKMGSMDMNQHAMANEPAAFTVKSLKLIARACS